MRTLFALLFLCFSLSAYSNYTGTVYVDKNKSGTYDKGDMPLADVRVTDGRSVVLTGKDGKFTLPGYDKTRFITVTTPSGYTTKNFYIPVDKKITTYDFALAESPRLKSKTHAFLHITDTEIRSEEVGRWVDDLKGYIKNEQPAFLIHTGDICYEGGLKAHIKLVNSQTMNCPVYYAIGNHDLVKGAYGEELFESLYGPTWFSFDVGNTHYVITPMAGGDHKPSYTREEVYAWLKNDLAAMKKGQLLVVFNHDILTTDDKFVFGVSEQDHINFRDYNLKAWIYGHWHYNYVRNQNGVYTICTSTVDKGGIDHSTSAFRVVNVKEDGNIGTSFRYAFIEPQLAIVSPMDGQQLKADNSFYLSVNTYNSLAHLQKITYAIVEKQTQKQVLKGELKIQHTDWNWAETIELPAHLKGKDLVVTVQADFSDKRTVKAQSEFTMTNQLPYQIQENGNWTNLLRTVQHTGNNSAQLSSPLKLAWTQNIGANIYLSSPLIVDSKVIVASADDNVVNKSSVRAYDITSGKLEWTFKTRNSIKNSIASDGGIVFAQDAEGYLYAIDLNTGKLVWEDLIDLKGFPYISEGLIAEQGIVYAGTGYGLSAYEAKTGKKIWTNKDWKQREGATTTLTLANDVLVSGTQWGALYANDAETGKMLWSISKDGMSDRGASPSFHDGLFYVISRKSLFIIESKTGEIKRKKDFEGYNLDVTSTPLVTADCIFVGTANKGIVAIDKESLDIKWNMATQTSLVFTAPYTSSPSATVEGSLVLSNEILYFGASDGYFYAVDQHTGNVVSKMNLGAPVFNTVAMSGNLVVISDFAGNVYTFVSGSK